MDLSAYKIAEPEVPQISREQFASMTREQQDKYLYLYKTQLIPKLARLREHHRFYTIHGGRGGGKSVSVAKHLVEKMTKVKHTLLCCREVQNSLAESSYQLLVDQINYLDFPGWTIQKERLFHENGSKVIFHGLRDTTAANSLKSVVNIDLVWCEEAQSLSKDSLRLLLPTIRIEGAEFYFTYNPEGPDDAVEVIKTRKDVLDIEINWYDNPFFPRQLLDELEADMEIDEDNALHVWFGQYRKQGDNCIMDRVSVKEAMERKASQEGDYSIGCDLSRFGGDASIFTMRKGMQVIKVKEYRKKSMVELADLYEIFVDHKKDICTKYDGGGVGGPFGDILKARGYRKIVEVNFGEKAMDSNKYDSAASEMWMTFPLSEAGIPNDDELLQQLSDRRYSYNNKTQKVVEKKEDYKKRHSGKSPDKADSLLLCFYEKHTPQIMLY